jgi:hypothetical protein
MTTLKYYYFSPEQRLFRTDIFYLFPQEESSEGFQKAEDAVLATRMSVHGLHPYNFCLMDEFRAEYAAFQNALVGVLPLHRVQIRPMCVSEINYHLR